MLQHLLLFDICAREICEKFVYKHIETIEYVLYGQITREFLGLRMRNFQGIVFI